MLLFRIPVQGSDLRLDKLVQITTVIQACERVGDTGLLELQGKVFQFLIPLGELLGALERYIHADDDLPPLVRAGLLHVQFETLHPYLDGNGRLGRLLIALLLITYVPGISLALIR